MENEFKGTKGEWLWEENSASDPNDSTCIEVRVSGQQIAGDPLLAKKVHHFRDWKIISECGKWMFGGGREDISALKPDAICK